MGQGPFRRVALVLPTECGSATSTTPACNFLFCDGHADSRKRGGVVARDVCLNP